MEKSQIILVVDDDPGVLRLFETILKRGGYSVVAAESGKKALEVLRSESVSLVVLDISMPEPDGFEVLKTLRAFAPGLRTLAVSGFMDGALLEVARILGATATLSKPDAPEHLLEMVNQILKW